MNQRFEFETYITCVLYMNLDQSDLYLVLSLFSFAPDLPGNYNPKTMKK